MSTKKGLLAAVAFGLVPMLAPSLASATGGVWCDAKDKNLSFHFESSSSRDGTGGWWGIGGKLEIKSSGLPSHLAVFDIKDENLTQRWWDGHDVRLEIQKYDSDPFARVRLTLMTTSVDEGLYNGKYDLDMTLVDGTYIQLTGAMVCDAD